MRKASMCPSTQALYKKGNEKKKKTQVTVVGDNNNNNNTRAAGRAPNKGGNAVVMGEEGWRKVRKVGTSLRGGA
jgi:hypothetical protein